MENKDFVELNRMVVEKIEKRVGKLDQKYIEVFQKYNRLDFIDNVCILEDGKKIRLDVDKILSDSNLLKKIYNDIPINFFVDEETVSSISSPSLIFYMIKLLNLKEKDKVLEIGSGTGYSTALLSSINDKGFIFSAELNPSVYEILKRNVKRLDLKNVYIENVDGGFGLNDFAPFDNIIVFCGMADITRFWIDQLKTGGKIVAPLSTRGFQVLVDLKKDEKGRMVGKPISQVHFFPLKGNFSIISHYSYYEKSLKSLKNIIDEKSTIDFELTDKLEHLDDEQIKDFLFYLSINDENFITYYPYETSKIGVCYGIFIRNRGSGIAFILNKRVFHWGNEEAILILKRRFNEFIDYGKPKIKDWSLKVYPSDEDYLKTGNDLLIYRKSSLTIFSR